jgi:arylsulfatase A-like enzyme
MPEGQRPNVLFVHADQHRYDCVSANGHGTVETPTLDRLAAEGARFEHAYTPTAICSPERASLMTGRWPTGHEVFNLQGVDGGRPLPRGLETFSERLADAGYANRYVGRWHLGHGDAGGPENFGFEEWVPPGEYQSWREEQDLPERPDPGDCGWTGAIDPVEPEESRLAWGADRAIEHLEDLADAEAPFFLRWDTFEPHLPNVVPEPYASMYGPEAIDPWGNFGDDYAGKPWIQGQQPRTWHIDDWTWDDWAPIVARYLGEITLLDHQLGRVLDRLEELGLAEDTLVVYTADHGDMCGGHGMMDKHFVMYDDVMRVPLLARWPGEIDPGTEVEDFVIHALDLAATFCDVAGAGVPDEFAGESLRPLFGGEAGRTEAYGVYYGCQMGWFTQRMLRTERWKYVWNATAPDELYDLRADPHELENLADADPENVLPDLRRRLADWLRDTDDSLANPWVLGQLDPEEWVW